MLQRIAFEEEEEQKIKLNRRSEFGVTPAGLRSHQRAVEILEVEQEALAGELSKLRKNPDAHKKALTSFLNVQRRLSELSGVEGLVAGHRAHAVSQAKAKVTEEPERPEPVTRPRKGVSGPVVPID